MWLGDLRSSFQVLGEMRRESSITMSLWENDIVDDDEKKMGT